MSHTSHEGTSLDDSTSLSKENKEEPVADQISNK